MERAIKVSPRVGYKARKQREESTRKLNKLLFIPIIILFTGCSALSTFDSTEYNIINTITTTAEIAKENCNNKELLKLHVESLYYATLEFKNYVNNTTGNVYLQDTTSQLVPVVKELHDAVKNEEFSTRYCELKLSIIYNTSSGIQRVSGYKGKQ